MQVFLGDEVTLVKKSTHVIGQVAGVVLDDKKELDRIYIHNIDMAFWMSDGWMLLDDTFDEEEEDGEI